MAQGVLIAGESGSGKSTGIESLDPKKTFIINVAGKNLTFKGWKKNYTEWNKDTNPTGNVYSRSKAKDIENAMNYVSKSRPEIKSLIVDDWQYTSAFEFFDRVAETGFQKFTDIGADMVRTARLPLTLRDDLTVYFLIHIEKGSDVEGAVRYKVKTLGKMIDEKVTLEGLFTIVLFTDIKKNKDGTLRYVFETKNSGNNTCKSPKGMFATAEIPNDLKYVEECIHAYNDDLDQPTLPIEFVSILSKNTTPAKQAA